MKILDDITPMAEAWIEKLTRNQTRALLATALHEELVAIARIDGQREPILPRAPSVLEYDGAR